MGLGEKDRVNWPGGGGTRGCGGPRRTSKFDPSIILCHITPNLIPWAYPLPQKAVGASLVPSPPATIWSNVPTTRPTDASPKSSTPPPITPLIHRSQSALPLAGPPSPPNQPPGAPSVPLEYRRRRPPLPQTPPPPTHSPPPAIILPEPSRSPVAVGLAKGAVGLLKVVPRLRGDRTQPYPPPPSSTHTMNGKATADGPDAPCVPTWRSGQRTQVIR